MVNVEMRTGKHSMFIPKGMNVLIANFLEAFVPAGNYVARLGKKVQGSEYKQGMVKAVEVKGNILTLAAQPGGNGTRFECVVVLEGQDAQGVFSRMRKLESTSDSAKLEKPLQLIETKDIQEERKMEIDNREKVRLNIKKILANSDELQIILLALSEQQEKTGCVNATACNELLRQSGLMGTGCSKMAVAKIFSVLARKGYLEKTGELRCYKISEKSKEMLLLRPAIKTSMVPVLIDKPAANQEESEIEKNRQDRVDLVNAWAEAEKVSKSISASVKEAESALAKLRENEQIARETVNKIVAKLEATLPTRSM